MVFFKFVKGFVVVFALLLLCSAFVSAELVVNFDKQSYNLGDSINVAYSFSSDQDFSGLVKLSLACSDYSLDFYVLPTNIDAGQAQQVTVPSLVVSKSMLGKCFVSAIADSYDHSISQNGTSEFFNVTSIVSMSVQTDKQVYLPGESVKVSGQAVKSHFLPASVLMSFLDGSYTAELSNNSFSYSIVLPKNIKSGNHGIDFSLNDSYGNSGTATLEFGVEAVPTRIVNTMSELELIPGQPFSLSSVVYDQADDQIQSQVSVAINNSEGGVVVSASGATDSTIPLVFPTGQAPGAYTLISSSLGLVSYSHLVVKEVENVSVSVEGSRVVLKNTGNINYVKQFNVSLSGKKSYVIKNNVELAPGETFEVNLGNAVSTDDYAVAFPTVLDASPVSSLHVNDERSSAKKVFDYLRITGRNVQEINTGSFRFQAVFAPVLIVIIIAMLAFFFLKNKGKRAVQPKSKKEGPQNPPGPGPQQGKTDKDGYRSVSHVEIEDPAEEARIKRIIDEKHRLQQERNPAAGTSSLRDDPYSKKFVKDMMKDKPMR